MTDAPEIRRTLGFLLQETSRLLRRRFVQHARETGLGLNRSEASVLLHVFHAPGLSQAALSNSLDIDTISVVRLVDSLQAAGLIERRPHATDRRVRTLWLTEQGQAKLVEIKAVTGLVRRQALAGMPEERHQELLELLCIVRGNLAAVPAEAGSGADEAA